VQNPGIVTLYDADVVIARTADRANQRRQHARPSRLQRRAVQRGEKLTLGKPEFEVFRELLIKGVGVGKERGGGCEFGAREGRQGGQGPRPCSREDARRGGPTNTICIILR